MKNDGWLTLDQMAEKIRILGEGYDDYVEYIDNYNQYLAAKRNNDIISKQINLMAKVFKEMRELVIQYSKQNENAIIYYKKGNFKLVVDEKVRGYRKSKYSKK